MVTDKAPVIKLVVKQEDSKSLISSQEFAADYITQHLFATSPPTKNEEGILTPVSVIPGHLFYGCKHHLSGCKIQCNECKRFFCCKRCHDKIADHELISADVKLVWCFRCKEVGKIGSHCAHCGRQFARYYCNICHLYEGTPFAECFHCEKCLLKFFYDLNK